MALRFQISAVLMAGFAVAMPWTVRPAPVQTELNFFLATSFYRVIAVLAAIAFAQLIERSLAISNA
jgi:hypothetical protein